VRATALIAALALSLAACGGDGEQERSNEPRPPTPINVTAAIDDTEVRVSRATFGAGPVVFIVSNQSSQPQQLTFETDELGGDTGGIRRSTREIAPRSTAELKVDPPEGSYRLSASSGDVSPASIEVSRRRKSAQGELLLP
jgi:hypothetical protein